MLTIDIPGPEAFGAFMKVEFESLPSWIKNWSVSDSAPVQSIGETAFRRARKTTNIGLSHLLLPEL